ncbi:MAG TPA: alpha/beta hydrolase, partial [Candidatus Binataceae bacterium]|nr:alpha/beta hydrolase [Candidatus Binataceae bacterium]
MPAGSKFTHRQGEESLSPEEVEQRRREAEVRGEIIAGRTRRHAWLNIAGPLGAVIIAVMLGAFYKNPIGVLRWVQATQLGWSGVTKNEVGLDEGLMTYYINGGYPDMEPVVMIHGLGPNAALVWREVMGPVGEGHYKVMAPNLYGFADSEHKQVEHSIAYQAAGIGKFIDQMKIDKVNLIGWDLGADVALYYAVDHPDKIERLILVSGGLFGESAAKKLRQDMIPTSIEAMQTQAHDSFFDLPPMPSFIYERMMAQLAGDAQAETEMLNSLPKDEGHIRSKLGQLFNTLAVITWGGKDPYFGAAQGNMIKSALPGSATIVFKTSGHYPQL